MTWGEVQIESLKKMFLNNTTINIEVLETLKSDKNYEIYLNAMPQACNEAINYIASQGKPIIKEFILPYISKNAKYRLNELIPDFKKVITLYYEEGSNPLFDIIGTSTLIIKEWNGKELTIYYEAIPEPIKDETSNDFIMQVDEQFSRLIPLYIAGEVYKDDDLALATMYMNEFMNNVNILSEKDKISFGKNEIRTVYAMEV